MQLTGYDVLKANTSKTPQKQYMHRKGDNLKIKEKGKRRKRKVNEINNCQGDEAPRSSGCWSLFPGSH